MTSTANRPRGRPAVVETHPRRALIEWLIGAVGPKAAAAAIGDVSTFVVSEHRRRCLSRDPLFFATLRRLENVADRSILRKAIIAQAKRRSAPRPNRRKPFSTSKGKS